jgi:hypothetical protein
MITLLFAFLFLLSTRDSLAIISPCPNCTDVYCEPALLSENGSSISSVDIGTTTITSEGCSCPCSINPISPIPTCQPLPNCYYDQDHPCAVRPEFENQYCPANTPTPQSDCIPLPECLYYDIPCLVPPSELPYCPINDPTPIQTCPTIPAIVNTCPYMEQGDFDCDGKITILDYATFYTLFFKNFDRVFTSVSIGLTGGPSR